MSEVVVFGRKEESGRKMRALLGDRISSYSPYRIVSGQSQSTV